MPSSYPFLLPRHGCSAFVVLRGPLSCWIAGLDSSRLATQHLSPCRQVGVFLVGNLHSPWPWFLSFFFSRDAAVVISFILFPAGVVILNVLFLESLGALSMARVIG